MRPHPTHHRPARARRRAAHTALCAAIAATTVCGAGAATADPPPGPAAADCPRWTALLVPGTFETAPPTDQAPPVGVLTTVAESLTTRYRSDIGVRTLLRTTEATSEQALAAALSTLCSQTRVVLAGNAEGAAVVGDLAAAIGNNHGPLSASQVVAVGLVSDPHRDPSTPQLGGPVAGSGVAGPRPQDFGELTDRIRTLCPEKDRYCSTFSQESPALDAVVRALTAPPGQAPTTTAPATAWPSTGELTVSRVLAQVVTVVNGLSMFAANVPAIVADLAELPALLGRGDVPRLHRVAGDLNNQFAPLVAMADGIDLRLVAHALALAAPLDTTGIAAIASEVVGVLAGLDIARIATTIGRAQEIAWNAAEILIAGDPVGAVLALSGLAPIAADLLAATASAFTGTQFPSLAQTYTATTGTGTGDPAHQDGDTAVSTGHDTAAAALLANWLTQMIDATT
ncbi:cutinase family protein [Nocardia speluncae]|uniref:Cutinase family protein n=1 Tax=Nocardia speluncae TaxID=419477 RepID=A0A846XD23_9NOCA|nr:cutinase family protein [Nocardia speluncae]NKY33832.1 cutinase family protein [Nocardia speluncae]